jgi:hypothetical protein
MARVEGMPGGARATCRVIRAWVRWSADSVPPTWSTPRRKSLAVLGCAIGRPRWPPDTFAKMRFGVLDYSLRLSPLDRRAQSRPAHPRLFPKTEGDLTATVSARVRRLDCRRGCLLVRVKLACGSTEANGRSLSCKVCAEAATRSPRRPRRSHLAEHRGRSSGRS